MKKARSAAARLWALGTTLTVLLAGSFPAEGIASPDVQTARPEGESKNKDSCRRGAGFDVCADHDNHKLPEVEEETPGEPGYRKDAAFPAKT